MSASSRVVTAAGCVLAASLLAAAVWFLDPWPGDHGGGEGADVRTVASSAPAEAAPQRKLVALPVDPALDVDSSDRIWVEKNNAAVEALESGDLERALTLLEECHRERPDRAAFQKNLAEALLRRAIELRGEAAGGNATENAEAALAILRRAVNLAPGRVGAADLLGRWEREAEVEGDQHRVRSAYFEIGHDAERTDLVLGSTTLVDHLEATYADLRDWFGNDPVLETGRLIRVSVLDREAFGRVTGLGDWAGGAFDGVVRIAVEDLEAEGFRWRGILRHELTHAFVRALGGPGVPGWLNEGLAQRFEGRPSLAQARARLGGHPLFTLDDLARGLSGWEDTDAISRAYAQSLVLVERIASDHGEDVLRRMVKAPRTGGTAPGAFEEALGFSLDRVVEDLRAELVSEPR